MDPQTVHYLFYSHLKCVFAATEINTEKQNENVEESTKKPKEDRSETGWII